MDALEKALEREWVLFRIEQVDGKLKRTRACLREAERARDSLEAAGRLARGGRAERDVNRWRWRARVLEGDIDMLRAGLKRYYHD